MLLNSNKKKTREIHFFLKKKFDRRASEFSHEKMLFELNAREKQG